MTWAPAGRDSHDIEALVTDRYLETILDAHARGADSAPAAIEADPVLRQTMARLAREPAAVPSVIPVRGGAGRSAGGGRRAPPLRHRRVAHAGDPARRRGPDPAARGPALVRRPAALDRRGAHLCGAVPGRRRLARLAVPTSAEQRHGASRPGRRSNEAVLMPLKLPSFRARRNAYPPDLWTKCPDCP